MSPSLFGEGHHIVWLIRYIIEDKSGKAWASGTKGELVDEGVRSNLYKFQPQSRSTSCMVQLSAAVRVTFSIPACKTSAQC